MNPLDAELALDRLDGLLATELSAHVRAFAAAHARGTAAPAAPAVLGQRATLAAALVGWTRPALAARGLALTRLVAPIILESDPRVAAIRARAPDWADYGALRAARDAAAVAQFGHAYATVIHDLHGTSGVHVAPVADAPIVDGWAAPDARVDAGAMWASLAARYEVSGTPSIVHAAARPRAFVVVPGREVIVVVPAQLDTPAARFAALHELGHAIAALAIARPLPRVVDEAVASLAARAMEDPASPFASPLAAAARARRLAIAARLDAIERGASPGDLARPPWALWHDAGAQATYVAAETIADELAASTAPFATTLAAIATRVDRATPS